MLPNHLPLNPNHCRSMPIIADQSRIFPHFPTFFCTFLVPHAAQSFATQSQPLPINAAFSAFLPHFLHFTACYCKEHLYRYSVVVLSFVVQCCMPEYIIRNQQPAPGAYCHNCRKSSRGSGEVMSHVRRSV